MSPECASTASSGRRKSQAGIGLALSAFSVYTSLVYSLLGWSVIFFAVIPRILGKTGQGNSILELPMTLITWENATKST